jgi:ABC-2 type transport system ATP-binding protein
MIQRLHLARGLLNDPRLLLLDEPTNGLDPEYAVEVRALVREIATGGAGILLTTHLLGEAEALADHVVVIDRGRVLVEGSVQGIGDAAGIERVSTVSVPAEHDARLVSDAVAGVALTVDEKSLFGRTHLRIEWRRSSDEIEFRRWLDGRDGAPIDYASRAPTLEESYLALTTSHDHDRADPNA